MVVLVERAQRRSAICQRTRSTRPAISELDRPALALLPPRRSAMSNLRAVPKAAEKQDDTEDASERTARQPSPPPHMMPGARGLHVSASSVLSYFRAYAQLQVPNFSSFQPRDVRFTSMGSRPHVAWSCDGRKLASVGMDKSVRVWSPDKSVSL